MRQDYLSTSYLDKKYFQSEQSEMIEMWIDPSNVCWDNPVSIFEAYNNIFLIPFTILQMKSDQNVVNSSLFCMPLPWQIINKWADLVVSRHHKTVPVKIIKK